jgi:hypothetical protein
MCWFAAAIWEVLNQKVGHQLPQYNTAQVPVVLNSSSFKSLQSLKA